MLPYTARLSAHEVERAGRGIECESLPPVPLLSSEAEFAGRNERKPKDHTEIGLVPVPTDTGTCLILREEDLPGLAALTLGTVDISDRTHRRCLTGCPIW